MIFEDELGIRPSEWLRYEPLDAFLGRNAIPILPVESKIIEVTGLHWTMLRLVLASLMSILAGILHRFFPTATGMNSHMRVHSQRQRDVHRSGHAKVWRAQVRTKIVKVTCMTCHRHECVSFHLTYSKNMQGGTFTLSQLE
jgi:hypothetical protein